MARERRSVLARGLGQALVQGVAHRTNGILTIEQPIL